MRIVRSIVRGSIDTADSMEADMYTATRDMLAGVVRGTGNTGAEALETISETAREAVRTASDLEANLTDVAEGAVKGAASVAVEAGVEPREAASAAAEGVLRAASEIGEPAIDQVVPVIKDRLAGIADATTPMRDYVAEDGFGRGYN